MVHSVEGNRAKTTTMPPVLKAFLNSHRTTDVAMVADAGSDLLGEQAIEEAGVSFILGARTPNCPT